MCILHIISFFSGGLEAVTYTDVLQCTIMLLGGVVLSALGKEYRQCLIYFTTDLLY